MPPAPLQDRRDTHAGRDISVRKLNGQVYTPLAVAARLLDMTGWPERGPEPLLDPACGDGVFLEAALRKAARCLPRPEAEAAAEVLEGWDVDPAALEAAGSRIAAVRTELGLGGDGPVLRHRDALSPTDRRFPVIVGNPPYLEAKRMPDALKARIRAACPRAARGAFDLYAAFLERADALLPDDGRLAFVVPNRFLVLHGLADLRRHFLSRYRIQVVDLSHERVFADAAVYPILLHARRHPEPALVNVPEAGFEEEIPAARLLARLDGLLPLLPSDAEGQRLLLRLLADPALPPLGHVATSRWCVSFHRAGLRDRYTFDTRPDSPHARPFLGGGRFQGNRELEPYRIRWAGGWIDHDEARARADRNPLPPRTLFDPPKVVLAQNARRARAALDETGLVLKDTFLCLHPRQEPVGDWLRWLVLVLNSDVFHHLWEHLFGGTRKGGGFLHYLPGYLDRVPFPPLPSHADVRTLHDRLARGDGAPREAEEVVRAAYGVTPEESAALARYPFPAP